MNNFRPCDKCETYYECFRSKECAKPLAQATGSPMEDDLRYDIMPSVRAELRRLRMALKRIVSASNEPGVVDIARNALENNKAEPRP